MKLSIFNFLLVLCAYFTPPKCFKITAVLWNELWLLKVRLSVLLSHKLSKIMIVNEVLFILI